MKTTAYLFLVTLRTGDAEIITEAYATLDKRQARLAAKAAHPDMEVVSVSRRDTITTEVAR